MRVHLLLTSFVKHNVFVGFTGIGTASITFADDGDESLDAPRERSLEGTCVTQASSFLCRVVQQLCKDSFNNHPSYETSINDE